MEQLLSMGFTLGTCLKALALHPPDANGGVDHTLTWLLEQQAAAEKNGRS